MTGTSMSHNKKTVDLLNTDMTDYFHCHCTAKRGNNPVSTKLARRKKTMKSSCKISVVHLCIIFLYARTLCVSAQSECETMNGEITYPDRCVENGEKDLCRPGNYVKISSVLCDKNGSEDDRCVACEPETFMPSHNFCTACLETTKCTSDQEESRAYTATSDRECIPKTTTAAPKVTSVCPERPPCQTQRPCTPCPMTETSSTPSFDITSEQILSTTSTKSTSTNTKVVSCLRQDDSNWWKNCAIALMVLFGIALLIIIGLVIFLCKYSKEIRKMDPKRNEDCVNYKKVVDDQCGDPRHIPLVPDQQAKGIVIPAQRDKPAPKSALHIENEFESQNGDPPQEIRNGFPVERRRHLDHQAEVMAIPAQCDKPGPELPTTSTSTSNDNRESLNSQYGNGDVDSGPFRANSQYTELSSHSYPKASGCTEAQKEIKANQQKDWPILNKAAHNGTGGNTDSMQPLLAAESMLNSGLVNDWGNDSSVGDAMQGPQQSVYELEANTTAEEPFERTTKCNATHIDFVKDQLSVLKRNDLFAKLGIKKRKIEEIFYNHNGEGVREQIREVLLYWKDSQDDPAINKLVNALRASDSNDVVNEFTKTFCVKKTDNAFTSQSGQGMGLSSV